MFDLPGDDFPASPEALREALEWSVRRRVQLPGAQAVALELERWPEGRRLAVNLDGGRLDLPREPGELRRQARQELKPPAIVSGHAAGPVFGRFEVRGDPVQVGPMRCRLLLEGHDVQFEFGRDAAGKPVMAPSSGSGRLEASVPEDQLVAFLRQQAIEAAAEKGVRLEQVDVALAAPGPRALEITGTMRGRKKVAIVSVPFAVDFSARVEVDEQLVGHVRALDLHGHGMILDTLMALLRPKLEQVRARPIVLREILGAFVPAALGLDELSIGVNQYVTLQASFGRSGASS